MKRFSLLKSTIGVLCIALQLVAVRGFYHGCQSQQRNLNSFPGAQLEPWFHQRMFSPALWHMPSLQLGNSISMWDHPFGDMWLSQFRHPLLADYGSRGAVGDAGRGCRTAKPKTAQRDIGPNSEKLVASLPVDGYRPSELSVTVSGKVLRVEGKGATCQCEDAACARYREFSRQYALPEGIERTSVRARVDRGGRLHITGTARRTARGETDIRRRAIEIEGVADGESRVVDEVCAGGAERLRQPRGVKLRPRGGDDRWESGHSATTSGHSATTSGHSATTSGHSATTSTSTLHREDEDEVTVEVEE